MELEVKGTLQVAKKRNDDIQASNVQLKIQLDRLVQQKIETQTALKHLATQISKLSSENEHLREVIDSKECM